LGHILANNWPILKCTVLEAIYYARRTRAGATRMSGFPVQDDLQIPLLWAIVKYLGWTNSSRTPRSTGAIKSLV
jgi:hypothetical protein